MTLASPDVASGGISGRTTRGPAAQLGIGVAIDG